MQIKSPDGQRPRIHFTFNNFASVKKPMSLELESIETAFDSLSFYGLYKDLPSPDDPAWSVHHDVDLPRAVDIRFIDFPIVIDHCDALSDMLISLESKKLTAGQEEKLAPLRIAIKMHEIAQLVAAGKVTPGANGMTPIIYTMTEPASGKVTVGWRFEPTSTRPGASVSYDTGIGIAPNKNATVAWIHPIFGSELKNWARQQQHAEINGFILRRNGECSLGRLAFDPNLLGGSHSLNHTPIQPEELDDIVMVAPMPHLSILQQHPIDNAKIGMKVIAWDHTSTEPRYEIGTVEGNQTNRRYQGYAGLMFNGTPFESYQCFQRLEEVVAATQIHQYNAALNRAKEVQAVKNAVEKSYPDLFQNAISAHEGSISRHQLTYNLKQIKSMPAEQGENNVLASLTDPNADPQIKERIKFQLQLFGHATQIELDGIKTPVYMHEMSGGAINQTPGGGWAVLMPREGLVLQMTGDKSHAVSTIASSIAQDIAVAVLEREPTKTLDTHVELQSIPLFRPRGMRP